jgi:RND family efflux transporter MFP subunit
LWASQVNNQEKTYAGSIREIAPAASSATRAFDVRVTISDPDSAVKLGMTAGVRLAEAGADEIIIPTGALTQINGKSAVWVIDKKNVANPREVVAGQYTENGVMITSGLQSGEMVAIAGVHTLMKGQKVAPKLEAVP